MAIQKNSGLLQNTEARNGYKRADENYACSSLCQIASLDAGGQVSKQYPLQELPVVGGDKSFER
ncbi:MAG: hypothetical protein ACKOCH_12840, partial [Bacteroidota bacterium]